MTGSGSGTTGDDDPSDTDESGGSRPAVDPDAARLTVAVFRPDDERLDSAIELIESLGGDPVPDPMLSVVPTGATPRPDAGAVVLTSKTGVDLVADAGWDPEGAQVCAIGERTAGELRAAGYEVDLVPEEYSSAGLVAALEGEVDGSRVEVARSDHGSTELIDGLVAAGAYVHETVLYRLVRPEGSGHSTELAAEGDLDVALFTSSLTVEHFLDAAQQRGIRDAALEGLAEATVAAIGDPTRETAEGHGIEVDLVPERATFEQLATEAVELASPTYHE